MPIPLIQLLFDYTGEFFPLINQNENNYSENKNMFGWIPKLLLVNDFYIYT